MPNVFKICRALSRREDWTTVQALCEELNCAEDSLKPYLDSLVEQGRLYEGHSPDGELRYKVRFEDEP